ncbi:hypothetical protein [Paenibacillus xylanexedens]|uniref:hypothetical protein n=1 Tax=Paenibacillus xylanexedens TaxID=528191 RepID=UPI0011A059BB|nr:hypothetical protein [Paenibacillus xylanexedens]
MTLQNQDDKADELVRAWAEQFQQARKEGGAAVDTFLAAMAYAMGSFVPLAFHQESHVKATAMLVEDMMNGLHNTVDVINKTQPSIKH